MVAASRLKVPHYEDGDVKLLGSDHKKAIRMSTLFPSLRPQLSLSQISSKSV